MGGSSSLVTGDLDSLSGLAKLKHVDLSVSQLWGDVTHLPNTVEYANFASSKNIFGKLEDLPSALIYGNFRAAIHLKGDVKDLTNAGAGANCALVELDISGAAAGNIKGELQKTGGGGVDSLVERCPHIMYLDLGSNYGTSGTTDVKAGNFDWTDATNLKKCIK